VGKVRGHQRLFPLAALESCASAPDKALLGWGWKLVMNYRCQSFESLGGEVGTWGAGRVASCPLVWPALTDHSRCSVDLAREAVGRSGSGTVLRLWGAPLLLCSCASNMCGCADEVERWLRDLAAKMMWSWCGVTVIDVQQAPFEIVAKVLPRPPSAVFLEVVGQGGSCGVRGVAAGRCRVSLFAVWDEADVSVTGQGAQRRNLGPSQFLPTPTSTIPQGSCLAVTVTPGDLRGYVGRVERCRHGACSRRRGTRKRQVSFASVRVKALALHHARGSLVDPQCSHWRSADWGVRPRVVVRLHGLLAVVDVLQSAPEVCARPIPTDVVPPCRCVPMCTRRVGTRRKFIALSALGTKEADPGVRSRALSASASGGGSFLCPFVRSWDAAASAQPSFDTLAATLGGLAVRGWAVGGSETHLSGGSSFGPLPPPHFAQKQSGV